MERLKGLLPAQFIEYERVSNGFKAEKLIVSGVFKVSIRGLKRVKEI